MPKFGMAFYFLVILSNEVVFAFFYYKAMEQKFKTKPIDDKQKIRDYILRYLEELKMHFNLSDKEMREILHQAHWEIRVKNPVKNLIYMIKSFLPLKRK